MRNWLSRGKVHANSLKKENSGVTALEFALCAPWIIFVITAIIDLGIMMLASTMLEGATSSASRLGKTGFVPDGQTREQYVRAEIERLTPLLDPSQLITEYFVYETFAGIGQPEPYVDNNPPNGQYDVGEDFTDINGNGVWDADQGRAGLGDAGDIVLYRSRYRWRMMTPLQAFFPNGETELTSWVPVRNEVNF